MTLLKTDRLVLRPVTHDDTDTIARLCNDLAISRWLTVVPHPYTRHDAETFLKDRVPFGANGHYNFAITLNGSDELVGLVAADALESDVREFGYWLAPDLWRQGLVSEAARPVVDWVFHQGNSSKLCAGCDDENTGSRRLLNALGFAMIGSKKTYVVALDAERTSLKFELTREHWETSRAR